MVTIVSSLVQKTGNLTVDTSRACSNKRGEKNKYSHDIPTTVDT